MGASFGDVSGDRSFGTRGNNLALITSDNPSDLTNLSGSSSEVLQSVFLCYLPAAIYGGNTPAPIAPQVGTLVLLVITLTVHAGKSEPRL